jgi:hypothetical protein
MVRQGSLGLRAELDSGDAHGKRETGANMNGRIWSTRPLSRIRCADGADEMISAPSSCEAQLFNPSEIPGQQEKDCCP